MWEYSMIVKTDIDLVYALMLCATRNIYFGAHRNSAEEWDKFT